MASLRFLAAAMSVGLLLGWQNASAFSLDTTPSTNSDGSSRYADPEEQAEARFGISDDQNRNQGDAPSANVTMNPTGSGPAFLMHPTGHKD